MRKPIIAGNWKLNKTIPEAIQLVNGIKRETYNINTVDIVVCPPFTALSEVSGMINDTNIKLGAQDLFWEEKGAYTGEISAELLKDAGCKFVIVGHSERRKFFNETNQNINKKVKAAINNELIPIMCVGEKLEERESSKTFNIVEEQIKGGLDGISKEDIIKVIIAYEPVWAIGTGKNATPQQAEEVHKFIRKLISDIYDAKVSSILRIQYGGSVSPDNIEELIKEEDIDGALVGGASLKIDTFTQIIKKTSWVYSERG